MIRYAKKEDLDAIMEIVGIAKQYMKESGNLTQWAGDYPGKIDFEEDIQKKQLYVCYNDEMTYGVFAFVTEKDPNYAYIEDGRWFNEEPYGTIHRIAGNGKVKGVFQEAVDFAKDKMENLRIDTHEDNRTMRHLIEKNGFQRCGIVYMKDGSPRIAYQYVANGGEN